MKISIVVPVYNVEEYIQRCFASISQQTYNNDLLECIFVDDCGNDNSIPITRQLIDDYQGKIDFKIATHEKNKGLSEARNTGTSIATGEYIYYFDSDDEITTHCIQTLVDLAKKHKGVDVVFGSSDIINGEEHDDSYKIKSEIPEFSSNDLWLKRSILRRTYLPMTAWNKLIRLDFIKENDLFFKPGIIHEDEHWEFFVAKHINTAAFCKEFTYLHYINEGSIITTTSPKQIESLLIIVEDFLAHIDNILVKEQYKTIYYVAFYALIKSIDNHDVAFAIYVQKSLQQLLKQRFNRALKNFRLMEFKVLCHYYLSLRILKSNLARTSYYGFLKLM